MARSAIEDLNLAIALSAFEEVLQDFKEPPAQPVKKIVQVDIEPRFDAKTITVDMKTLTCCICMNLRPVYMSPMSCMHLVCVHCHKNLQSKRCPLCNATSGWIVNHFANRLTADIEVKCQYDSCDSKILLKNYEKHIFDCVQKPATCNNNGCKWTGPWSKYLDHRNDCDYYPMSCIKCKGQFVRGSIKLHAKVCLQREISCKKCNKKGIAWEIFNHMVNEHDTVDDSILIEEGKK